MGCCCAVAIKESFIFIDPYKGNIPVEPMELLIFILVKSVNPPANTEEGLGMVLASKASGCLFEHLNP